MTARPPDAARPGPPPSDGPGAIAFLLSTLGRAVRAQLEDGLAAEGLSLRHLSALGHLSREPGLSYSELARRARVTAQSMQATLRQLEERGAVERRTAPGRGRAARLHVTANGDALLARGRSVVAVVDGRLLDGLPAADRRDLARLLTAVMPRTVPGG